MGGGIDVVIVSLHWRVGVLINDCRSLDIQDMFELRTNLGKLEVVIDNKGP